jgi:NAD(P)-dependent dehydrogenase (short-subunit alcohol dehydrogenase family)
VSYPCRIDSVSPPIDSDRRVVVRPLPPAAENIRINAVCPGITRTAMFERAPERAPQRARSINRVQPMGRIGERQEIAQAVLWLARVRPPFVAGHMLTVDGGLTAV